MKSRDFLPFLTKFVVVTLDDDTKDSGYIANPEAFSDSDDDSIKLVLLNGLLHSEITISHIVSIEEAVREDTAKISIHGFEDTNQIDTEELDKTLNDLFAKSFMDPLDISLDEILEDKNSDD